MRAAVRPLERKAGAVASAMTSMRLGPPNSQPKRAGAAGSGSQGDGVSGGAASVDATVAAGISTATSTPSKSGRMVNSPLQPLWFRAVRFGAEVRGEGGGSRDGIQHGQGHNGD